jgi:peptidoglycan/LPS O-acetylase OafA/YrhL
MSRIFKLHRSEAGNLLNFAKGLAILLVFLHHYSRSAWISRGLPTPALLQFSYESPIQDFALLAAAVRAGHFTEVFLRAMAHFGYVGVHLFVMLSGLGLALGYGKNISVVAFLKRRAVKMTPPFWISVAFFALLAWTTGSPFSASQILERMFLLTTFHPEHFFIIDSPLWCLAVFLQVHLLFLPLRRIIVRFGLPALLPLAAVDILWRTVASMPRIVGWNPYFGHSVALNWLAIFGLGIWIGNRFRQHGELAIPARAIAAAVLVAIPVAVMGAFSIFAYPALDTALGLLITVFAFAAFRVASGTMVARVFGAVGIVSFPLYLYHRPLVTKIVHIWSNHHAALPPVSLGFALAALLTVALLLAQRTLRLRPAVSAWILGQ